MPELQREKPDPQLEEQICRSRKETPLGVAKQIMLPTQVGGLTEKWQFSFFVTLESRLQTDFKTFWEGVLTRT